MAHQLYPIVLEPVVLEKPWGGQGSGPGFIPGLDPKLKLGEIWITADGQYQSTVRNGPLAGKTLKNLQQIWGADLLGTRFADRIDQPFPLLLKFIHAAENLSVQVHPDDDTALRLEGRGPGKTEAWHILGADSGAEMVLGLARGVGRAELAAAIQDKQVETVLNKVKVTAGQAYYVPAGLLHAIGPGVSLFEIQQNVDITYRFYDWGRVDDQGRPRELHIDKALEALHSGFEDITPFQGLSHGEQGDTVTHLAAGRYFALDQVRISSEWTDRMNGDYFKLLTALDGRGDLEASASGLDEPLELTKGRTVLLPAGLGDYKIKTDNGLTLLVSFVPDLEADIIRPLQQVGFSDDEIVRLAGCGRPNDISVLI